MINPFISDKAINQFKAINLIKMKIKFKESKAPTIANITFGFNTSKSKLTTSKSKSKTHDSQTKVRQQSYFCFDDSRNKWQEIQLQQNCLLLKCSGFIPKNPNVKSVLFSKQRQIKTIKSLQSAKQLQKRFPVGKILSKRSSAGFIMRKDKVFSFPNPQIESEHELFKNKKITNSMIQSQSLFHSRKDMRQDSREKVKKRNTTSFQRYLTSSVVNCTTSLSYRHRQEQQERYRIITRMSHPNV